MSVAHAELVFGFVYAIGTNADPVASVLGDYLQQYGYACRPFRVSEHLTTLDLGISFRADSNFERMNALMNAGNEARCRARANDILATMAVNKIAAGRNYDEQAKQTRPMEKTAHLIRSLKTPDEVRRLRDVYRPGFFLIGIASDDVQQHTYLTKEKGLTEDEAKLVIDRDQDEKRPYGQRTRDTFYLADVFVELTDERYKEQLDRFLELVFGHPFKTPTRDEHAMFMAYASAARSAQLGRQVGAAVVTPEGDVVAVGHNEVPSPGGGPYWDGDVNDARDHNYKDKTDSNYVQRSRIVTSIVEGLGEMLLTKANATRLLKKLEPTVTEEELNKKLASASEVLATDGAIRDAVHSSDLKDITEYGRAVHAEMDAVLTCARLGISVRGKHLFTTTFPCHNCTRHIIAAGVAKVTYIEPYPKSRAAALHEDAICFGVGDAGKSRQIPFVPFVGVGPRRYLDLFSSDLSTGRKVDRKDQEGKALFPKRSGRLPRVAMLPYSYLERETKLLQEQGDVLKKLQGNHHGQVAG